MTFSLLVACTLVSGLFVGFIPTLVDCLKKSWRDRLQASPSQVNCAIRLFYFTWLPAMPLTDWLLDRYQPHAKEIFWAGLIGLVTGIAWLSMVRSVSALFGNLLVLGIAYSATATCTVRMSPFWLAFLATRGAAA